MNARQTLAMLLLSMPLVTGCRSTSVREVARPSPEPAATQMVESIREAFARSYPESRVGVVIAARPVDRLAAVGEVPSGDFREGQIVTFVDGQQRVLTTGRVIRMLPDSIHVRYDDPPAGGREPRPGDVMIRVAANASSF